MRRSIIRRFISGVATATVAMAMTSSVAMADTELLVYTAVEADELNMFKEAFEAEHPDINIQWVRDSTGIITAKLLAEQENPRADMVWGVSATSLLLLADKGYFQAYAPKGVEKLNPKLVGNADPPVWVGQRAYVAAVCVNTIVAENQNLPIPQTWQDLTDPVYRGHVVMPNPASSGTGFLTVNSWLQMWGEEKAWNFMNKLHKNIKWYTHSGSKPCRQAAHGEVAIGISFAYRGAQLVTKGAPLEIVAPTEGVGWDVESFAIVKGTDKLKAARAFADWSVTRAANELYNEAMAVVAMPGVAKPVPHYPPEAKKRMIENDLQWAANHRQSILDEWISRFGTKSLPKG